MTGERVRSPHVTTHGRSGPAWIVGLASFLLGSTCVVASRPAAAGDPDEPEARVPLDPWLVRLHRGPESSDPARLLPWVDDVAGAGRARAGTETGALLLAGAASELARRGGAPEKATTLIVEALGAFAPDDPRAGLLWLDLADVRHGQGDAAGAIEALDRADAVAARVDPPDLPYPGPQLRARLRDDLSDRGDGLRRHALSAVGRHEEAAGLWERRASRADGRGSDTAWEWAAEAAWAAGDLERALRDIDLAISQARDGGAVVPRVAWRIRAQFGQMTERGDAAYRPDRITDELFTSWRAAIRDHGDRPGGFQLALDAASFAMAGRRADEALELWSLAFTSPGFAIEAARSVSRRFEIVIAARTALTAGRPAQALAWIQLAEHHHGGALPHTEALRIAIEEALRSAGDSVPIDLPPPLEPPPPLIEATAAAPASPLRLGGGAAARSSPSSSRTHHRPVGSVAPAPGPVAGWATDVTFALLAGAGAAALAALGFRLRQQIRAARPGRLEGGPGRE